jgi:indole-3-glycerol phosphate synthase
MQTAVANLDVQSPVLVSESGISDPETVRELRKAGFRGFLIGECFMKEPDPAQALAAFVKRVETSPRTS